MLFDWSWISVTASAALMVILSAIGIYAALVLFTRVMGLRSLSKMSSFDFVVTIAFGTVLASTLLTEDPSLFQAMIGLATLFLIQFVVAQLRRNSSMMTQVVDNAPLLVMHGPEIIRENLARAQMTEADLRAKLREANVTRWEQVRAVVVETTGDVSVLHADPEAPALEPDLLAGVSGAERLKEGPA